VECDIYGFGAFRFFPFSCRAAITASAEVGILCVGFFFVFKDVEMSSPSVLPTLVFKNGANSLPVTA